VRPNATEMADPSRSFRVIVDSTVAPDAQASEQKAKAELHEDEACRLRSEH
jgi:hypothetical protein